MTTAKRMARVAEGAVPPDHAAVIAALPFAVVLVGADDTVELVNNAAEQLFAQSASALLAKPFPELVYPDSPLVAMLAQVRATGAGVAEHDLSIELPRVRSRRLTVRATPLGADGEAVMFSIEERSLAERIDRQLGPRRAARSMSGIAQMLAHEIKNPLSGIRGAAQLLEQGLDPAADTSERELTSLICAETDRICNLLDRMGRFAEGPRLAREAVNVHQVLERVRKLAEAGFASDVRFEEFYDPSLPPVAGQAESLIQVFLNLVKNAAEAVPGDDGRIMLKTSYQPGMRMAEPGGRTVIHVPICVEVCDNGPGIPDAVAPHLFEPFVTRKKAGTGLGLAMVAKYVDEHGGIVEFERTAEWTLFRVLLPAAEAGAAADQEAPW